MAVDLADREGAKRLVDEAVRALGGVDLLVNNVGGSGDRPDIGGFLDLDDEHWHQTFEVNLFAAVRVSRAGCRA